MPWGPSDAQRHTHKAKSAKAKRQWAHVANSAMERGMPEGRAIAMASGVVKKRGKHRGRRRGGRR